MGAYHTLDLELNRKFRLSKHEWDSVSLDRVEMACDPTKSADVAAVIMQDGLAQICLITSSMTLVRAKIEASIPRKRKNFIQQHEKALAKFYDNIIQGILRHIDFDIVKCVLIASPGFVRDQFYEYMFQMAVKTDNKILLENKSKFMLIHSSTGFKHSLKEILQDPAVVSKISDTKAASEVKALENFYTTLQCEPDKAFYGKKHVEKALYDPEALEELHKKQETDDESEEEEQEDEKLEAEDSEKVDEDEEDTEDEEEEEEGESTKKKKLKVTPGEVYKEVPWEKSKQERQEYKLREKLVKNKHRKLYKSMMAGRQQRAKEIWLLRKKRRLHEEKQKEERKKKKKVEKQTT